MNTDKCTYVLVISFMAQTNTFLSIFSVHHFHPISLFTIFYPRQSFTDSPPSSPPVNSQDPLPPFFFTQQLHNIQPLQVRPPAQKIAQRSKSNVVRKRENRNITGQFLFSPLFLHPRRKYENVPGQKLISSR